MRLPDPSPRAVRWLWICVGVLVAALFVWLVYTVLDLSDQNRTTQATNAAQDSALAEANRRLTAAGEQPVPTPEPGPVGEPGQVGAQGEIGPRGPQGNSGTTGPRGPRGAMGRPGVDGVDGRDGIDGAPGAKGDTGAAGPSGTNGKDGQNGADGKDGQSALPFEFSFVVQTNPVQSTTYTVRCAVDGCTVTTDQQ